MAKAKKPQGAPRYETLDVAVRNGIGVIALNRPSVHNAFNETLIDELTAALQAMAADDAVRVVVLAGRGKSFCAGADLNWMKKMAASGAAENRADARALARMLSTLDRLEKPTVASVHGSAFGGGVGLIACCDIAIAAQEATFAVSEAKFGLIPATISPYVIAAIGPRQARRLFLTAERITAAEAYRLGLVHDLAPAAELESRVNDLLGMLLLAGPNAQRACKALIRSVAQRAIDDAVIAHTVEQVAAVRASSEGREGVAAYVREHRPPFLTLYDDAGVGARAYEPPATSFIVIADRSGRVVYTGAGGTQNLEPALRQVTGR